MKLSALLAAACIANLSAHSSAELTDSQKIGLRLADAKKLDVATEFTCDSGLSISISQLNDDFCDCEDGSDEPGTSACSHTDAKFFCVNKGLLPKDIPTAHVNDKICDCCDGSDEYASGVKCRDTCIADFESDSESRKLQEKIMEAGAVSRQEFIELAVKERKKIAEEIEEKKVSIAPMLKEAQEKKKVMEAELAIESAGKELAQESVRNLIIDKLMLKELPVEKLHRLFIEIASKSHSMSEISDSINIRRQLQELGGLEYASVAKDSGKDADTEIRGLIREYINKRTAAEGEDADENSKEAADLAYKNVLETTQLKEITESNLHSMIVTLANRMHGKRSEIIEMITDQRKSLGLPDLPLVKEEEEHSKYVEEMRIKKEELEKEVEKREKEIDRKAEEAEKRGEKFKEPEIVTKEEDEILGMDVDDLESPMEELFTRFQNVPYSHPPALTARNAYNLVKDSAKVTEREIEKLQKVLDKNYGKDDAFWPLRTQCFIKMDGPYEYKLCPFEKAYQDGLSLGQFDRFEEDETIMIFEKGANCWNGPDRTMKVKVECGVDSELYDIDEPEKCVYEGRFRTPAACYPRAGASITEDNDSPSSSESDSSHDEL